MLLLLIKLKPPTNHSTCIHIVKCIAEASAQSQIFAAAGISDTRQLDSVLRSVDQAQGGLTIVFETLAPLPRRSATFTPLQLRQVIAVVALCLTGPSIN